MPKRSEPQPEETTIFIGPLILALIGPNVYRIYLIN